MKTKRILISVLAIFLLFALVSCGATPQPLLILSTMKTSFSMPFFVIFTPAAITAFAKKYGKKLQKSMKRTVFFA